MPDNDETRPSSATPWIIAIGGALMLFCFCGGPIISLFRFAMVPLGYDPYGIEAQQELMQLLRESPEVEKFVGEPLELSESSGVTTEDPVRLEYIDWRFEVRGSKGSAKVHAQLYKDRKKLTLMRLEVRRNDEDGGPIILLDQSTAGVPGQR